MLIRVLLGLGITAVCLAVAGRRFWWLYRLIRSGQPDDRRWQGVRRTAEAELVEVAGQRKLLKWTVPGLAHVFTMWGFVVLLTTVIEAYGALFSATFHIPLIGQSQWLAFTEDFFATAVATIFGGTALVLAGGATLLRIAAAQQQQQQQRVRGREE